ncbi:MAG: hypothetical protein AB1813_15805 [Verrucomicrobiota bacterium]
MKTPALWGSISAIIVIAVGLQAAPPPVSSPEGTQTSYAEGRHTMVYPPRAARAQKVEFDTPDKQMIHEPDTPFRGFFNSHSADFAPGKLDYAKTTILGDVVSMLQNKRFIRDMIEEVVLQHVDTAIFPAGKLDENNKAQKQKNAQLVISAIALALERENYPDLRDEDIERVLNKLDHLNPTINANQLDEIEIQNTNIWSALVIGASSKPMSWDLRQVLRERRYFSNIIDRAVSKRLDLFQSNSPLGPLRQASATLEAFINNNIGTRHATTFADSQTPLWQAFVASLNGPEGERLLRKDGSDTALDLAELSTFGDGLRTDVVAEIRKGATLEKAVEAAIAPRRQSLRNTKATARDKWKAAILNDSTVVEKYREIELAAAAVRTARSAQTTAATAKQNAEEQLRQARVAASNSVSDITRAIEQLAAARKDLDSARDTVLGKHLTNSTQTTSVRDLVSKVYASAEGGGASTDELNPLYLQVTNKLTALINVTEKFATEDTSVKEFFSTEVANFRIPAEQIRAAEKLPTGKGLVKPFAASDLAEGDSLSQSLTAFAQYVAKLAVPENNPGKANMTDAITGAKLLLDQGVAKAGEALKLKTIGASERSNAVAALTADATYSDLVELPRKESALDDAERQLTSATASINSSTKTYSSKIDVFLETLQKSLARVNASLPTADQLALTQVESTIKQRAKDALDAILKGAGETNELGNVLGTALTIPQLVDVSENELKLVKRFLTTFDGYPELIGSREPILKAVLQSGKIQFGSPELGVHAVRDITSQFASEVAKASEKTPAKLVEILNSILNKPELFSAFASPSRKTVDAFKSEFYNAFKHRLASALAAEREADYDYWWLSFFPKAIAVGDNRFQGQSVLEIGFNESVVPTEQYHRWLEDQYLDAKNSEAVFAHKIRLASAVLNDFLIVLDASDLSGRYPGVREVIQQALQRFTAPLRKGAKNPSRPCFEAYRSGLECLLGASATNEIYNVESRLRGATVSADSSLKLETQGIRMTEQFLQRFTRTNSLPPKDWAERFGAMPSMAGTQVIQHYWETDPVTKYFAEAYRFARDGENRMADFLDESKGQFHKTLEQLGPVVRTALAWEPMDIRHVTFAVITATSSYSTLPEKVELYCSAFFGGTRRYASEMSPADHEASKRAIPSAEVRSLLNYEKYVVPYADVEEQLRIARYLLLKGVAPRGLADLLKRYHERHIANYGGGMSSTIYKLIQLLDPGCQPDSSLIEKSTASHPGLNDYLREASYQSTSYQRELNRYFFRDVQFRPEASPQDMVYLSYPPLWPFEMDLDEAREDLRFIVANLYHSRYPSIPQANRIKSDFLQNNARMRSLVYLWLRDLYIEFTDQELLPASPHSHKLLSLLSSHENSTNIADYSTIIPLGHNVRKRQEGALAKVKAGLQSGMEALRQSGPLFSLTDLKSDVILAASLNNALALKRRLPRPVLEVLSKSHLDDSDKSALLDGINTLIMSGNLYDTSLFPDARLRQETKTLLKQHPGDIDLVWLNRMLLEDMFRDGLHGNAAWLRSRKPFELFEIGQQLQKSLSNLTSIAAIEQKYAKDQRRKANEACDKSAHWLTASASIKSWLDSSYARVAAWQKWKSATQSEMASLRTNLHEAIARETDNWRRASSFVESYDLLDEIWLNAYKSVQTKLMEFTNAVRKTEIQDASAALAEAVHQEANAWRDWAEWGALHACLEAQQIGQAEAEAWDCIGNIPVEEEKLTDDEWNSLVKWYEEYHKLQSVLTVLQGVQYDEIIEQGGGAEVWNSLWLFDPFSFVYSTSQRLKRVADFTERTAAQAERRVYPLLRVASLVRQFASEMTSSPSDNREEASKEMRRRVMATLLLDRHPYLTDDSRKQILRVLVKERSIFDWVEMITEDQHTMDQLSAHLLEALYRPLFSALDSLNRIERQEVPFQSITLADYERFRLRSKPQLQRGIQIVDLLPASRDDLVGMAINEGGVVAKIAAQAEGAAAYDLNQLQTVLRNAEILRGALNKDSLLTEQTPQLTPQELLQQFSTGQGVSRGQSLTDFSQLNQGAGLSGYTLGAAAKGSVYARAQSALAYSRRREYLDAAITAAGRGDSFAKWVIRKSDLRSELAKTDGKKLVAAAHSGQPNGDQPFHMLVKVPRSSLHTAWDGKNYIFFSSTYSATGRQSFWKTCGIIGAILKAPFTVVNHNAWHKLEEHTVSAVYPFTWNVQRGDPDSKVRELVQKPNILGGRIQLDDTDKIRYSEVQGLLNAEAEFIQLTRSAQLADVNRVMGEIKTEGADGKLRSAVRSDITNNLNMIQKLQADQTEVAKLREKQQKLEEEFNRLKEELKKVQEQQNQNPK